MMRLLLSILFFCAMTWPAHSATVRLPRTLVALYDGKIDGTPRGSPVHRFLEMPANHLGYDIQYYDVNGPLPVLGSQVAAAVLWFDPGFEAGNAVELIDWLENALRLGKKVLLIENSGFGQTLRQDSSGLEILNHLLGQLGIRDNNSWQGITYQSSVTYQDRTMLPFEQNVPVPIPPFMDTKALDGVRSHLKIALASTPDQPRDLIVTSPRGGYVAQGFAMAHTPGPNGEEVSQWIINPFTFLEAALDSKRLPKPDTTTMLGRRIFFGLVDGDGWNQPTELPDYARNRDVAAEVIRREILLSFADLAFNVGIIGGDIDENCYGTPAGKKAAQDIGQLPNVELAAHSYTHPLQWKFFEQYTPQKEVPYLKLYPPKPRNVGMIPNQLLPGTPPDPWAPFKRDAQDASEPTQVPRLYGCMPFDLDLEIRDTANAIEKLTGVKSIRLLQWSGDSRPFERALIKTRLAGLYNIGGSSSNFESGELSLTDIGPIGIKLGQDRQIYSGYANEVTYTNYWGVGFSGLTQFINRAIVSNLPRRLAPLSYYFQMNAGQKQLSVRAVADSLQAVRQLPILPITASQYAALANGFYTTSIIEVGEQRWMVRNRGGLQTIRFDKASLLSADMLASKGVIGQSYLHGDLYIYLDPQISYPIIQLKKNEIISYYPQANLPYVLESRWQIRNLIYSKNLLMFAAYGYGAGSMRWKMPQHGRFEVTALREGVKLFTSQLETDADNVLTIVFPDSLDAVSPLDLNIRSLD